MKKQLLLLISAAFLGASSLKAQLALDLNGPNNYAEIIDYELNVGGFTIQYDFYMNSLQNFNGGVTFTVGNGPAPIDFYVNSTGQITSVVGNGVAFQILSSSNLIAQNWYNITYVYDGGNTGIRLYLNGNLIVTHMNIDFTTYSGFGTFRIGDRGDGGTNANAKFDNVKIWSIPRTNTELVEDMTNCFSGNETGLDILYKMEEGSGTILNDLALANGPQNAIIAGSVAWTAGVLPLADEVTINVDACDSYTYTSSNGVFTWTQNTTHIDSLTNQFFCDSVVTINVFINPVQDKSVSASPSELCDDGSSVITTNNSEVGVHYVLRDDSDNSIVAGPVFGTRDDISFTTGTINTTTAYNVFAERQNSGSLTFNGSADQRKVSLGTAIWDEEFEGNSELTVEAWVNRSALGTSQTIIGNYQGSYPFLLRIDNGIARLFVNTGTFIQSSSTIMVGTWTHIAATYDGTNLKIFINGVEENSTPYALPFIATTNEVNIGGGLTNGTEFFEGDIGEVRLWNVARSAVDISASFNRQLIGDENGLVGYYKFSEGSGTIAYNSASIGLYDGTLINDPTWVTGPTISSTNCSDQMTQTATVTITTIDNTTSVLNETITANMSGATYQWVDCNNGNAAISGANGQTYTATANGNYAVEVTQNGCSEISSCIAISTVGINEYAESTLRIYPNPTTGMFTLVAEQVGKTYRITDNLGKVVAEGTLNNTQTDINLSNSANGLYLVTIEGQVFKLVKQ